MQKIAQFIQNNPYIVIGIFLFTIITGVIGIAGFLFSISKKQISFAKSTYEIIQEKQSSFSDIQILFHGTPVANVSITKFVIWYSGRGELTPNDFVERRKLQLQTTDDKSKILEVQITVQNDPDNGFDIVDIDGKHLEIMFEYLTHNDGIVLQVIHTGNAENISLDGKIIDGKKLFNYSHIKRNNHYFDKISTFFGHISLILASFLLIVFCLDKSSITLLDLPSIIQIVMILLSYITLFCFILFLSICVIGIFYAKIAYLVHKIPRSLRSYDKYDDIS